MIVLPVSVFTKICIAGPAVLLQRGGTEPPARPGRRYTARVVALRARTQTHTETPRPKRTTCDVHPPWIKSRATDGPGALPAPGLRKTATVVPQQRLAMARRSCLVICRGNWQGKRQGQTLILGRAFASGLR